MFCSVIRSEERWASYKRKPTNGTGSPQSTRHPDVRRFFILRSQALFRDHRSFGVDHFWQGASSYLFHSKLGRVLECWELSILLFPQADKRFFTLLKKHFDWKQASLDTTQFFFLHLLFLGSFVILRKTKRLTVQPSLRPSASCFIFNGSNMAVWALWKGSDTNHN